jgi:hypothetical protein
MLALTEHVNDWHVSVKLGAAPLIAQEAQFGSLNVMVAAPCACAMLKVNAANAAAAINIRMIRVMAGFPSTKSPCTAAAWSSWARRRLGEFAHW